MDWSSNRPLLGDSVRLDIPDGRAWIAPEVLQTPDDTSEKGFVPIKNTWIDNLATF